MKQIIYLTYLIFVMPIYSIAQRYYSVKDSLVDTLTLTDIDKVKARVCFLLFEEWSYIDTLKGKQLLDLDRKFSGRNKYVVALYKFFKESPFLEKNRTNTKKEFLIAYSLLMVFSSEEAYYFRARLLQNYCTICKIKDDFKIIFAALMKKAIPFAIKSSDKEYLAKNYAYDGSVFSNKWQNKYSMRLESTSNNQLNKELKYQSTEKQNQIISPIAKNKYANLLAKNSRLVNWLLGSISLFVLAVVTLGYFFYNYSKKAATQKELIKITQAMLQGQEEERKRIARDLHDGLGSMLATIKMNLSGLATAKEESKAIKLNTIIRQLDNSVKELHRIAYNMMPEMLLKLGLEVSLIDLCESQISENLEIDFQYLDIKKSIPVQAQIIIYRIIQELLANVVKHAAAKNILLQCSQSGTIFFITIEDDGIGFDTTKLSQKHGMGLSNIKSRIAFLNGKMEILSNQNQGTCINIEVNVTT